MDQSVASECTSPEEKCWRADVNRHVSLFRLQAGAIEQPSNATDTTAIWLSLRWSLTDLSSVILLGCTFYPRSRITGYPGDPGRVTGPRPRDALAGLRKSRCR